jgi:hypothetical protein
MTNRFRWPVEAGTVLAAPSKAVWALLSTPEHLTLFHPFVAHNPIESWAGRNSRDAVIYYSGLVLERTVTHWENEKIDLQVGRPGGQLSGVKWRLQPRGNDETELTITIEPNIIQTVPWPLRMLPFYIFIIPSIRSYLNFVLQGLDFYLKTGEKVKPDQFGRHPVFSSQK